MARKPEEMNTLVNNYSSRAEAEEGKGKLERMNIDSRVTQAHDEYFLFVHADDEGAAREILEWPV